MSVKPEAVNHPAHYGGADNPYEAIKVIEAWELGFCLGNTVKYIARAGRKGDPVEDLKKARWYLDRAIANLEPAPPRPKGVPIRELSNGEFECTVCRLSFDTAGAAHTHVFAQHTTAEARRAER